MKPFTLERNEPDSGISPERVRSYSLIDPMTSTIAAEVMERTAESSTAFPLEPRGKENAVVMSYAWSMLAVLRDASKYAVVNSPIRTLLRTIEKSLTEKESTA